MNVSDGLFGLSSLQFVIAVLIIVFVALLLWASVRQKRRSEQGDPYLQALEYLVDGQEELAIEQFKEAIHKNSNNINAYLRLGDMLREQGLVRNALRIHRELTLRENLNKDQELRIRKSLILDYEKHNDYENGINIARQIVNENRRGDKWILEKLVYLYEKAESWEEAIEATRKYLKPLTAEQKRRISLYLVFQGLDLHKKDKARDGRIKFKEALKLNPACSAAYFYLGKSYQSEGRLDDAIREWRNFCYKLPNKAHIVFPYFEKACFDKGIFEEVESLYKELIDLDVKNMNTVLALVEFYLKKGRYETAHSFLEKAEEDFTDVTHLTAKKVEVLYHLGRYQEAARAALQLRSDDFTNAEYIYTCEHCGFESNEPLWRCPQCKTIDSFSI